MRRLTLQALVGLAITLGLLAGSNHSLPSLEEIQARHASAQEATVSPEPTASASPTGTPTEGASPTNVATPTPSATVPASPSPTPGTVDTATVALTATPTPSETPAPTETATPTYTPIATLPPTTPTAFPTVEAIIDNAGGEITSADGHATIRVPAGATGEPLLFRVRQQSQHEVPSQPAAHVLTYWSFDAFAIERGNAEVTTFNSNLTVELSYNSDELYGLREDVLHYWVFKEATSAWEELPVAPIAAYRWSVSLPHFSTQASSSDGVFGLPPILENAQVNLNTGASSFTLPIHVAPGVNGTEPAVALTYNSSRVDELMSETTGYDGPASSWVGVGWELSMPSITRAGNRFYLNLGGSGGELVPKVDYLTSHIWNTRDHQFLEITHNEFCHDFGYSWGAECSACNDAAALGSAYDCSWTVRDQSGRTWKFGANPNSRRFYATAFGWPIDWYFRHYQWDLTSVADAHGNVTTFDYEQIIGHDSNWTDLLAHVVSSYPKTITYPGGRVRFNLSTNTVAHNNYGMNGVPIQVRPDVQYCNAYQGLSLKVFETRALGSIVSESWDNGAFAQTARYDFNVASDAGGGCPNSGARLTSVNVLGRSGGPLHTVGFNYAWELRTGNDLCNNQARYLTSVTNGFGGETTFNLKKGYDSTDLNDPYGCTRWIVDYKTVKSGTAWTTNPDLKTTYTYAPGGATEGPIFRQDGESSPGTPKWVYRGYRVVEEIDLANVKTRHTFLTGGEATPASADELAGRETQTELFASDGTSWLRTTNVFQAAGQPGYYWPGVFFNTLQSTDVDPKGSWNNTRTYYTYEATPVHGRILAIREEGDSVSTVDGCRKAVMTYYVRQDAAAYLVVPATTQTLSDPVSGSPCSPSVLEAETALFYDGASSAPAVGNLTAVRSLRDKTLPGGGKNYVWVLSSYYANGNPKETSVPVYGDSITPPLTGGVTGVVWSDKGRTLVAYDPLSDNSASPIGRFPSTSTTYVYFNDVPATVPTQVTSFVYDRVLGVPKQVTGPNGLLSETTYDEFGRVLKTWSAPDTATYPTMEYVYSWIGSTNGGKNSTDAKARLVTGTTTASSQLQCADGLGRATQGSRRMGDGTTYARTQNVFDVQGRVKNSHIFTSTTVTGCDPATNGEGTSPNRFVEYHTLGMATKITESPAGAPVSCQPSCRKFVPSPVNALEILSYDERNNMTKTASDGLGRSVRVWEAAGGGITFYDYDALDRLTKVTDAAGNITTISYDALGRKTSMSDPDMGVWTYEYDEAGNLTKQTDARGVSTNLTYDSLNRLRGKTYTGMTETPVTFTYDTYDPFCTELAVTAIGMLTQMTDGSGATLHCYDARGNAIKTRHTIIGSLNGSYDVLRTYNSLNQIVDLTYPGGEVVRHSYSTSDGSLTGICEWSGSVCLNAITTPYLSNATLTEWGAPASLPLGNATTTNYTYDHRRRVKTIVNSTRQNLTYYYDEASNITQIADAGHSAETLSFTLYDSLNRLVDGAGFGGSQTAHYEYNSIGNLLTKQEGASSLTLTYGPTVSGPCPSRTLPHAVVGVSGGPSLSLAYDCNGNMVAAGTETYSFDVENRLKTRTQSGGPIPTSYLYDGTGSAVKRTNAGGTTATVYVEGIYEQDSVDGTIRKYYYAYGRPIAMRKIIGGVGSGAVNYFLADHLGTTATMVSSAGAVMGDMSYWPFGGTRTGGMPQSDRRYTGQREETGDSALGLYNYNARFYSTTLGRFVSADPIVGSRGDPQSWNAYTYVRNNPMRLVDPTGLFLEEPGDSTPAAQQGNFCGQVCRAMHTLAAAGLYSPKAVAFALGAAEAARQYADAIRWTSAVAQSSASTLPEGNEEGSGWGFRDLLDNEMVLAVGVTAAAPLWVPAVGVTAAGLTTAALVAVIGSTALIPNDTGPLPEIYLYRGGPGPEDANRLEAVAERSEAEGGLHSISTWSDPTQLPHPVARRARLRDVALAFTVVRTGPANHYDIIVDHPVSTEDAVAFNALFSERIPLK